MCRPSDEPTERVPSVAPRTVLEARAWLGEARRARAGRRRDKFRKSATRNGEFESRRSRKTTCKRAVLLSVWAKATAGFPPASVMIPHGRSAASRIPRVMPAPLQRVAKELAANSGFLLARHRFGFKARAVTRLEEPASSSTTQHPGAPGGGRARDAGDVRGSHALDSSRLPSPVGWVFASGRVYRSDT